MMHIDLKWLTSQLAGFAARMGVGLALLYAVYAGVMFTVQRRLVFPNWLVAKTRIPVLPSGAQWWYRDLEEGHVEAIFISAPGVARAPLAVFFHGNAERVDDWISVMLSYQSLGVHVLMVEYRGYNRSAGEPSLENLVDDALYLIDRAVAQMPVEPSRIIYHGRSIGGAVACAVAARRVPAALILQSTFTSIGAMARKYWLPPWLVRDAFDNASVLASLKVPILMTHGHQDRLIPIEHLKALAVAAPHAQIVTYDADHNDCPPDYSEFFGVISKFLSENTILGH